MDFGSEALSRLVSEFAGLPGIGRKTARRLAFFMLSQDREAVDRFAKALVDVKSQVGFCDICFNVTEQSPCSICADVRRATDMICVVEEPSDVLAIEATGEHRGLYHVLHGVLSPLDGVGPDELKIRELVARAAGDAIGEVILALNPDTEGDATAFYLQKLLAPQGCDVSRIARGIPVGGDLEFADSMTLGRAIRGREKMSQ